MPKRCLPRCLLLDHSASERASLRQKIDLGQLATVVGEASSLVNARHLIATEPHDLVLTDTRLGSGDAMQLASELSPGSRIAFISERAADAVRAFECDALDFLPKPVTSQRLAITFSRLSPSPGCAGPRLREVHASHLGAKRVKLGQKLCIRSGSKARLISPDQIISIAAQDN
jgi:DNA-binding LytR/AlgR family response regulator